MSYPKRSFAKGHYKKLRKTVGSQTRVARELDLDKQTISRRERGLTFVTVEMEYAMRYMSSDWGPLHWKETDPHTARPMDRETEEER